MRPEEKEHLRILDGIALPFVAEAAGDVAAVTSRQATDKSDVYYAKYSACDSALDSY